MKRDLSFLNREIIRRIKKWVEEDYKWKCPFCYPTEEYISKEYICKEYTLFGYKHKRQCDYCKKIFPGIKNKENPKTTIGNCPCGHYKYRYVKQIAKLIVTKETQS